jgi:hypothetical protein
MGGHTFKVKVPTSAEYELMYERVKDVDESVVELRYQDLAKPFLNKREEFEKESDVKFTDNDVVVKEHSLRETARSKVMTENRIVEFVKLLVPEDATFDMATVIYPDVEELFPFAIQLQLVDEINAAISPNYKDSRSK